MDIPFLTYQTGKKANQNNKHSVGEAVGKQALTYIAGGSINLYNPSGEKFDSTYQTISALTLQSHFWDLTCTSYNMKISTHKVIYGSIGFSLQNNWKQPKDPT